MAMPELRTEPSAEGFIFHLEGEWTIRHAPLLERAIATACRNEVVGNIVIQAERIAQLDTAGSWLILKMYRDLRIRGNTLEMCGLRPAHEAIFHTIGDLQEPLPEPIPSPGALRQLVERLGCATVDAARQGYRLVGFIGEVVIGIGRCVRHPARLRGASLAHHIDATGVDALPIIGLIAFLISVVLAYQGATQLQKFGADIFMINLVAVSVLREMGVLLTAIMVAGRSGSAFTAQIGTMQVNEEVDALRTLGMNPVEVLVLPRILALMITLPLLTFFADIMGLFGGAVMAFALLDVSIPQYINRLDSAISAWTFWVGMIKAPFFAFLIGTVGCLRGMEVSGSAESVGRLTTTAVVESIFLVLVADALFSILFAKLGI